MVRNPSRFRRTPACVGCLGRTWRLLHAGEAGLDRLTAMSYEENRMHGLLARISLGAALALVLDILVFVEGPSAAGSAAAAANGADPGFGPIVDRRRVPGRPLCPARLRCARNDDASDLTGDQPGIRWSADRAKGSPSPARCTATRIREFLTGSIRRLRHTEKYSEALSCRYRVDIYMRMTAAAGIVTACWHGIEAELKACA